MTRSKLTRLGVSARWPVLGRPAKYRQTWKAERTKEPELAGDSLGRQFRTARKILEKLHERRGVLLADDVGLGKTTVAALVAAAFVGRGRSVRILAPNAVMMRRWRSEIRKHFLTLAEMSTKRCAARLVRAAERLDRIVNLVAGDVEVTTHGKKSVGTLRCRLLIVDEAHRSRKEESAFGQRLLAQAVNYDRVLLLTATPFSLSVKELEMALRLVGAGRQVREATMGFGQRLGELWEGDFTDAEAFGTKLGKAGAEAIRLLREVVIRHGVDDLGGERRHFGEDWAAWKVPLVQAEDRELELLVRADRMMATAKRTGAWPKSQTNDARYHQGFRLLREDVLRLPGGSDGKPGGTDAAAQACHRDWLHRTLSRLAIHPKMSIAVKAIRGVTSQGEKVLVFCDYIATAQELTEALSSIDKVGKLAGPPVGVWRKVWREEITGRMEGMRAEGDRGSDHQAPRHLRHFVEWLCSPTVRAQTLSWLGQVPPDEAQLRRLLSRRRPRQGAGDASVAEAASRLFRALTRKDSRSTRSKLSQGPASLPGWGTKVASTMATVEPPEDGPSAVGVYFPGQPDTVLAVFNSPFGPDVLVTTDKLSEGVDLHRCCRHLMHYELDPSPIRTVQRRGRLRRIDSWAAHCGKPLLEAFPEYKGSRDEALVRIMRRRLAQFDLLLGGVGEVVEQPEEQAAECAGMQAQALEEARRWLEGLSLAVVRRGPAARSPRRSRPSRRP